MADNGEQDLETRVEDADVEELEDEEEMKKRHRQEARVSGVVGKRGSWRHGSHGAYCRCEARVARVYHGWVQSLEGKTRAMLKKAPKPKKAEVCMQSVNVRVLHSQSWGPPAVDDGIACMILNRPSLLPSPWLPIKAP